jgi:hypothetical protein
MTSPPAPLHQERGEIRWHLLDNTFDSIIPNGCCFNIQKIISSIILPSLGGEGPGVRS